MAIWGYVAKPATSFVSRIFKKPASSDGFGKFVTVFSPPYFWAGQYRASNESRRKNPLVDKFIRRQPMTATEKRQCAKIVLSITQNWCKSQKKNIQAAITNIKVIPPPPPPPPKPVTVSASYKPVATTQEITKSRDVQEVVQAGLFKIPANLKTPLFILMGGIAILSIFKLGKGSAR